jgi:transposase
MLQKYYIRGKNKKLSYRYTDTSFIYSRNGGECVKYNKFFGRKKCCKLSLITDINGIPFNIGIYGGNIHDSTILLDQLKSENIVNVNSIDCKGIIGDKYFLADSGYDTIEIKKNIFSEG